MTGTVLRHGMGGLQTQIFEYMTYIDYYVECVCNYTYINVYLFLYLVVLFIIYNKTI